MNENKRSFRVLAGVFLLISIFLGLASVIFSFVVARPAVSFFQLYWSTLLSDLIVVLVAVFILSRKFVGAAIAECVAGALALLQLVSFVITMSNINYGSGAYIAFTLFSRLLGIGMLVLLILGFFKHDRSSKLLFLLAAILGLVNSLLSVASSYFIGGYSSSMLSAMLLSLVSTLFFGSVGFLAWLFLSLYFGAQGTQVPAEAYEPVPRYDEPQPAAEPQPAYPQPDDDEEETVYLQPDYAPYDLEHPAYQQPEEFDDDATVRLR